MKRVEDLMSTDVVSVPASASIDEAEQPMRVVGIRHLPVVDEKRHLVGILSNRDLLPLKGQPRRRKTTRVADVMTRKVTTVRPDTPAYLAAKLMIDRKIDALPVVSDDDQLVGIVTATDFLRVASRALQPVRAAAR